MAKITTKQWQQRLARLEAQLTIRNCLNRYMEICDTLSADTDLDELMGLFGKKSVWEGIGEKYATSFGRYDSWQAIRDMFETYTQQQSHFVMNAHFISSEQLAIKKDKAKGTWLMLQTSTFQDGRSHLNGAKLYIRFRKNANGKWKIKHFQTQNIFSRPISHWHSDEDLPVPNS